MELNTLLTALQTHLPEILRWSGAIAKRLRHFNIAVENKTSGSALTDALTLADLTLQELIVAALRDRDPIFLQCRIEAEEKTGDLNRFAEDAPYVLSIDPIDGTKQYRDKTADGYCVMVHLRDSETVHYSLVYIPETGAEGTWVEAVHQRVVCGLDDQSRPARDVLDAMPDINPQTRPDSKRIYLIGFQDKDTSNAKLVTETGLKGVPPEEMPGSIYDHLATGDFGGSLIHTPNVYDFPVSLHIARILGGDAVWVHNGKPVNFHEHWLDERADMLRLPGITACSANPKTLETLCQLAKDWSPIRYED
ncbi:MAG: inositol monophosphatase [Planctomycetes bacterium]|nr:inositol monophosphatase [Planctomycetota bacterium]MCH9728024.1 inositol monophosphatase [Planctomycetota bacterium]MCH9775826.1 inositol monophosphatase [Planctomycetota bacterium]MCH9793499.1 inositol monophosphatase [Planctomycetota bacterium]MDF1744670.1 inositol monophosphatase [Gimesia sp.]